MKTILTRNGPVKNWSRKHTLFAGLALILLTNAVALLGVMWNRSGEPESVLQLTQRELRSPYWSMNEENSGVSLRLNWRVLRDDVDAGYYGYSGGSPDWLDQTKMESLGFDVTLPAGVKDDYRWTSRQLSREVLLVLELDGPAWQQALQHAQHHAAEQDAKLAALPKDEEMQREAREAHESLEREEQENSRLFAVDAGLDVEALRTRYPDRQRYAIVKAQVRPSMNARGGMNIITGYISDISIDAINVPHRYHGLIEPRHSRAPGQQKGFIASVAFGQRLEPWVVNIFTATRDELMQ